MFNYYYSGTKRYSTSKTVKENSWKNHSKEKTMKNFKTHKKLNRFKYSKLYRTNNCDLVVFVMFLQIFLLLATFTNCSEFNYLSYKNISEIKNITNTENNVKRFSHKLPSSVISYLRDNDNNNNNINNNNSKYYKQYEERLITLNTSTINSNNINNEDEIDLDKLQKIVMEGLGLKSLPDASKMNISQQEYLTKYAEYLSLVRKRKIRELRKHNINEYKENISLDSTITAYFQNTSETLEHKRRHRRSTSANDIVYVRFPVKVDSDPQSNVDEANLRILLVTNGDENSSHKPNIHHSHNNNQAEKILTLKVYQLIEPYGRIWLDSKQVEDKSSNQPESSSRWLEFDVTKAVKGWISGKQANLGLEIFCENCHLHGAYIVEDLSINTDAESNPVLNIIGNFGTHREKRSRQHHHFMQNARRKARKTDCYKENQKCCRHSMEVVFKEIKGFEFIIQPKVFDAGYCRGKCPPRYNPAHHHAFLQSLIWKQDRSKAPRPCCAPSKLVELEVLHVDENDSKKLKVSTWTDMRVLECACS